MSAAMARAVTQLWAGGFWGAFKCVPYWVQHTPVGDFCPSQGDYGCDGAP